MSDRLRVAVLVSGNGSNLQALIDRCATRGFPAEIACVVSNNPDAFALERAHGAGISGVVVRHRDYGDRRAFEQAIDSVLRRHGVDFVCLAGFMRRLTPFLVEAWWDRMINIHPSLLPAFRGLDTHRLALEAGVRLHGCTVHFVRSELDQGPIIVQAAVPVLAGDDESRLAARVLRAEHRAYPLALELIAQRRVSVANERVVIADWPEPDAAMFLNPPETPAAPRT